MFICQHATGHQASSPTSSTICDHLATCQVSWLRLSRGAINWTNSPVYPRLHTCVVAGPLTRVFFVSGNRCSNLDNHPFSENSKVNAAIVVRECGWRRPSAGPWEGQTMQNFLSKVLFPRILFPHPSTQNVPPTHS